MEAHTNIMQMTTYTHPFLFPYPQMFPKHRNEDKWVYIPPHTGPSLGHQIFPIFLVLRCCYSIGEGPICSKPRFSILNS